MGQPIEQKVEVLVTPIIQELGLELVAVEYIKEGVHWYLRLYIDKEEGVDLDDCTNVSHAVSDLLDKNDPIPQAYMLEVSSPGLERPLKKDEDFIRFQGKLVHIRTKEVFQGYQEFTGYLAGIDNEAIILEYENEKVQLPKNIIEKANIALEF